MRNLSGIREPGIVPTPPFDIWPEYDDDDMSDGDDEIYPDAAYEARSFWTSSKQTADEYADNHGSDPVVIRTPADAAYFETGETGHQYYYTTEILPPEMLSFWNKQHQQWQPI
jgi:hypothetical protein